MASSIMLQRTSLLLRSHFSSLSTVMMKSLPDFFSRWDEENEALYGPIVDEPQALGKDAKINFHISCQHSDTKNGRLKTPEDMTALRHTYSQNPKMGSSTKAIEPINSNIPYSVFMTGYNQTTVPLKRCLTQSKIKNESIQSPPSQFSSNSDHANIHELNTDLLTKLEVILSVPLTRIDDENFVDGLSSLLVDSSLLNPPSVSRVLSSTRSLENELILQRWREKMIKELGEDGFKKYQEDTLRRGVNFHSCIQSLLSGVEAIDLELDEENRGNWDSIQKILGYIGDVRAVESRITHPHLQYSGQFDCLASYTVKDKLCLIDWKTSQKQKPHLSSTYDHPLQAAAYIGALNWGGLSDIQVEDALLVIAYNDGSPGHAHYMNKTVCNKYWTQWLQRLKEYWSRVLSQ